MIVKLESHTSNLRRWGHNVLSVWGCVKESFSFFKVNIKIIGNVLFDAR
jgi:hypothetical protein